MVMQLTPTQRLLNQTRESSSVGTLEYRLAVMLQFAISAIDKAQERLEAVKCDLEASVYTLDEDNMDLVFMTRDDLFLQRREIDKLAVGGLQ